MKFARLTLWPIVAVNLVVLLVVATDSRAWERDGTAVTVQFDTQTDPDVTSDGAGGAIFTWTEYFFGDADIYPQVNGVHHSVSLQSRRVCRWICVISLAALRPSFIAQTTRDCPLLMSPAAKTPSRELM